MVPAFWWQCRQVSAADFRGLERGVARDFLFQKKIPLDCSVWKCDAFVAKIALLREDLKAEWLSVWEADGRRILRGGSV